MQNISSKIPFPDIEKSIEVTSLLEHMCFINYTLLWSADKAKKLTEAIDKGLINMIEIEFFVHRALLRTGKRSFDCHIKSKKMSYITYPGHTPSPDAFAYAIKNKLFNQKNLNNIEFDNETMAEFVNQYGKDVIARYISSLLDVDLWKRRQKWLGDSCCCY